MIREDFPDSLLASSSLLFAFPVLFISWPILTYLHATGVFPLLSPKLRITWTRFFLLSAVFFPTFLIAGAIEKTPGVLLMFCISLGDAYEFDKRKRSPHSSVCFVHFMVCILHFDRKEKSKEFLTH